MIGMDSIESLQALLLGGIIAGAAFSAATGTWLRSLRIGIMCGIATAFLLAAVTTPLWLPLGGISHGLS
jgi:hypothetical protein